MKPRVRSRLSGPLLALTAMTAMLGIHCAKDAAPPSPPASAALPAPPTTTVSASASSSASAAVRPGQKEGELCAGIAGLRCAEGLTCKLDGPVHPDESGTCARP